MRFKIACFVVFAMTLLSACTTVPARPESVELAEDERYVAMNLFINTNDFVTAEHARMLEYMSDSLESSGRFSRLDGGKLRWPISLQIQYEWERKESVGSFAAAMGSAATLMIVPAPITEIHRYTFEIEVGTEIRGTFEYEEELNTSVSIFNMGNLNPKRQELMNSVLAKFYSDLGGSGVVPLIRDVKEDPPSAEISI